MYIRSLNIIPVLDGIFDAVTLRLALGSELNSDLTPPSIHWEEMMSVTRLSSITGRKISVSQAL